MSYMIKLDNIKKHFKLGGETIRAVNDVSIEVEEGEFVAILGESGSGKSTLMNLIGGLDDANSGRIEVDCDDISEYGDKEMAKFRNQKIGFIFQTFNLQPTLTALENVELPLKFSNVPKKERVKMAKTALKEVGLGKRYNHKPGEMSGGERQRVSVARAIANKPKVILADEPTGNLDSATGQSIMQLLKKLNRENGITIVLITHSKEHATFAERKYKLKDGKLVK